MTRSGLAILAAVLLAACAPLTPKGGKLVVSGQEFSVDLPPGWYQGRSVFLFLGEDVQTYLREDVESIVLTRDGFRLQGIGIGRRPIDRELLYTKKTFAPGLSPQGAAELEVENLRGNPALLNLEVLESAPASIAGRPGFRLVYTWKPIAGLRMKQLHYGFLEGPWIYRLVYHAAARYYFDRDLATFEPVVASFRRLDKRS